MIHLRLEVVDGKQIRLSGLNPLMTDCLQRLGEILPQRDSPAAQRRLFPAPSAEPQLNDEWEKFVTPDLRHLFVSAGETVLRDLTALEPDPRHPDYFHLTFPAPHRNAWLSALNQARLILGAEFQVTEPDMDRRDLDPRQARDLALARIHLLGYLLQLFIEFLHEDHPRL